MAKAAAKLVVAVSKLLPMVSASWVCSSTGTLPLRSMQMEGPSSSKATLPPRSMLALDEALSPS